MSTLERMYFKSPVWIQNLLISLYGYRLYKRRYSGIYRNILKQIEESHTWSQVKVEAYQSEKLYNIIRHARQNIPYYGKLLSDHGLSEQDFTAVRDISKLPVLDKATLRAAQSQFRDRKTTPFAIQNTSGSTGTPLSIAVNESTYKLAMALVVDHEQRHGVSFGAPRATFAGRMIQLPENTKPPFSRFNKAENQRLFSSYHLNEKTFPFYADELRKFQPEELIGYPSAITELSYHYRQNSLQPGFRPKIVVTNSETLLSWQRDLIESVFGCKVVDYYGSAEYVVFASQNHSGRYDLSPLIGITELLPNAYGQYDVIATTLTNTDMPLIRYSIGDTAIPAEAPEGYPSKLQVMEFSGRVDDYILTPDGRKVGRMDHIFKGVEGVKEAQLVQKTPSRCTLNIATDSQQPLFEKKILENFSKRVGHEMQLEFNYVDKIPKGPNGKFKSVIGL